MGARLRRAAYKQTDDHEREYDRGRGTEEIVRQRQGEIIALAERVRASWRDAEGRSRSRKQPASNRYRAPLMDLPTGRPRYEQVELPRECGRRPRTTDGPLPETAR